MGRTFDELLRRYAWVPIRNCPGRYRLPPLPIEPAVMARTPSTLHFVEGFDPLYVVRFNDGGGLISYEQSSGGFVHTLCNDSGFARKLDALGIEGG